MNRLYLLRHAEAAAAAGGQGDRDRPLTQRGRMQAEAAGRWLAQCHAPPSVALHSPARRVRETVAAAARVAPGLVLLEIPEIYNADPGVLLGLLKVRAEAGPVLLAGHNPGIHALAMALAGPESDTALKLRLAEGYPPATLAVLDMPGGGWTGLKPGLCRLIDLVVQG